MASQLMGSLLLDFCCFIAKNGSAYFLNEVIISKIPAPVNGDRELFAERLRLAVVLFINCKAICFL